MESMKELIQILVAMTDSHTHLLDLAKEKRAILVDGNITSLQGLIHRESLCVEEIQKLEQQRMNLVHEYMEHNGLTGHSFSLEELINIQNHATIKTTLTFIAKNLRVLIQEITQINESNQQLIQTSLSYVQYSIGMHVQKEPAVGYGPKAKNRYSNFLDAKI